MADWQKMYTIMCRAADEALSRMPSGCRECADARALLQQAMYQAEEVYIASCDDDHSLAPES